MGRGMKLHNHEKNSGQNWAGNKWTLKEFDRPWKLFQVTTLDQDIPVQFFLKLKFRQIFPTKQTNAIFQTKIYYARALKKSKDVSHN